MVPDLFHIHPCELISVISEDTSFAGNVNILPLADQDRPATDLTVRNLTGMGLCRARPIPLRTVLMKEKRRRNGYNIRPAKDAVFLGNTLNHPEHSS
jgi:hypothetical protein